MKMKKRLSLILSLVLAAGLLAGCSGGKPSSASGSGNQPGQNTPGGTASSGGNRIITMGVSGTPIREKRIWSPGWRSAGKSARTA